MSGLNSSITSINGFGITWYGKSDFHTDGSYITTCWVIACYVPLIIALYVPLIPLYSLRVWEIAEERRLFGLIPYTNTSRCHIQKQPLHWRQIGRVYLYLLPVYLYLLSLLAFILNLTTDFASEVPHWLTGLIPPFLILWAFLPWYLRRRARRRLTQPPAKRKSVTNQ